MNSILRARWSRWVGGLGVGIPLLACVASGGVRVANRDMTGGELILEGDQTKAMEAAHQAMAAHCGGPGTYVVTREGQVAVGQVTQTTGQQNTGTNFHRSGASSGTTYGETQTTQNLYEYHVWYSCGAAPQAVAQPAQPMQDPAAAPMGQPQPGAATVNAQAQGQVMGPAQ
jgi:hypothetical protein